jgi:hypothetical protein
MPIESKKQADVKVSRPNKYWVPFLLLRAIVYGWYRYAWLHSWGILLLLIQGIFTGNLFTKEGLFYGGLMDALYLGLYFLNRWFERHDA